MTVVDSLSLAPISRQANSTDVTPTKAGRITTIPPTPPSTPRLRLEPTHSRRTLLDGGWWPRSTDPVAELPGLVLAIDQLRGPVTRLVLSADGWDSHPRRIAVADRILRLAYFTSQPISLLTALCDNGDRVDLLIVPPGTADDIADAAMVLAATKSNRTHAQHILPATGRTTHHPFDSRPEEVWEAEGGHLGPARRTPNART